MRIVTWNMDYWKHRKIHDEAWRWLFHELQPDIALLQECVPPEWVSEKKTVFWERAYPERKQGWGTALVTSYQARPARLPEVDSWLADIPGFHPDTTDPAAIHKLGGWCACAEIDLSALGPLLVINIHNPASPIEKERLAGVDISEMKLKLNPDLWLLDVVFYFLKKYLNRPLLIGGDFNYSRLLDELYGVRGNNEFFDRIQNEGFVSLHRKFHPHDERTFFRKKGAPHQLDYLYANSVVAELAECCYVVEYDKVQSYSDHAPLIAELKL